MCSRTTIIDVQDLKQADLKFPVFFSLTTSFLGQCNLPSNFLSLPDLLFFTNSCFKVRFGCVKYILAILNMGVNFLLIKPVKVKVGSSRQMTKQTNSIF